MSKYIDAVKAAEIVSERHKIPLRELVDTFAEVPPADVKEVKHAHWTDAVSDCWHCSECLHSILLNGGEEYVFSNYCPNCGARMDGGVNNG